MNLRKKFAFSKKIVKVFFKKIYEISAPKNNPEATWNSSKMIFSWILHFIIFWWFFCFFCSEILFANFSEAVSHFMPIILLLTSESTDILVFKSSMCCYWMFYFPICSFWTHKVITPACLSFMPASKSHKKHSAASGAFKKSKAVK